MKLQPYVGFYADGRREVFKTRDSEPKILRECTRYEAVLGPFKTLRGATFCSLGRSNNTIDEWEAAAKVAENARRGKKKAIEQGAAGFSVELAKGNITITHYEGGVLAKLDNAPAGTWDAIWNNFYALGFKRTTH